MPGSASCRGFAVLKSQRCLRLMSCLLAALAAFQPAGHLTCACDCEHPAVSVATSFTQDNERCCSGRNEKRCCAKHTPATAAVDQPDCPAIDWLTVLRSGPCECPTDCNCQLRHSNVAACSEIEGKPHESGPLAVAPPFPRAGSMLRPANATGVSPSTAGSPPASALALCAELCRFLA